MENTIDLIDDDCVESGIVDGETSEQFTDRIVSMIEARMRVLSLRD